MKKIFFLKKFKFYCYNRNNKNKKSTPFSMDFNIGYFKFKTLIVEELLDS